LNFIRFHKDFYNSGLNEDSLLENKLKRSFLQEKIHRNTELTINKKNILQEPEKNQPSEQDKRKIHESFYESFRIISPQGLRVKSAIIENRNGVEKKRKDSKKESEEEFIKSCNLHNDECFEDFTSKINEEQIKKYSFDALIEDDSLIRLLKQMFESDDISKYSNYFSDSKEKSKRFLQYIDE